jgi:hypothetical protein
MKVGAMDIQQIVRSPVSGWAFCVVMLLLLIFLKAGN